MPIDIRTESCYGGLEKYKKTATAQKPGAWSEAERAAKRREHGTVPEGLLNRYFNEGGMDMGPIGWFFVIFFSVVIVLGIVGYFLKKRDANKNPSSRAENEELFSEEEVGNVHNLNDQFNRARYMDKDGK